MFIGFVLVGQ